MCKKKNKFKVLYRSNIIQYDEMGYPLRLCIVKESNKDRSEQLWLDTSVEAGDVEIRWRSTDEQDYSY